MLPVSAPRKIQCYVTGQLRQERPEEHVRQRWARILVEEYGYPKEDMGVEVRIQMGAMKKNLDLVIYAHGDYHVQEKALIVVEVNRDDIEPRVARKGEDQLKSYMAACSGCRYGLLAGREVKAYRKTDSGFENVEDIPKYAEGEVVQAPVRELMAPTESQKKLADLLESLESELEDSDGEVLVSLEKSLVVLARNLVQAIVEKEPPGQSIVASRAITALTKAAEIESRRLDLARSDQDVDLHSPRQQKIFTWFLDVLVDVAKTVLPSDMASRYIQVLSERLEGWEGKVSESLKGVKSHLIDGVDNPLMSARRR